MLQSYFLSMQLIEGAYRIFYRFFLSISGSASYFTIGIFEWNRRQRFTTTLAYLLYRQGTISGTDSNGVNLVHSTEQIRTHGVVYGHGRR